jgi:hypothetical protein
MKLVRLTKMCLNKIYSKVCIGTHLSNVFPIQNGLEKGDTLLPLIFHFASEKIIHKVTGGWRKMHEELHNLYSSPNIRMMRWQGIQLAWKR